MADNYSFRLNEEQETHFRQMLAAAGLDTTAAGSSSNDSLPGASKVSTVSRDSRSRSRGNSTFSAISQNFFHYSANLF